MFIMREILEGKGIYVSSKEDADKLRSLPFTAIFRGIDKCSPELPSLCLERTVQIKRKIKLIEKTLIVDQSVLNSNQRK